MYGQIWLANHAHMSKVSKSVQYKNMFYLHCTYSTQVRRSAVLNCTNGIQRAQEFTAVNIEEIELPSLEIRNHVLEQSDARLTVIVCHLIIHIVLLESLAFEIFQHPLHASRSMIAEKNLWDFPQYVKQKLHLGRNFNNDSRL
jgi:hypothetical protein